MRFFSAIVLIALALYPRPILAQTTATYGESQIGQTNCTANSNSADFDTLAQCNASSGTGTFQKAPLFVGAMTSPPYSATTCSSSTAGMIQYSGGSFQGCNGSAWGTFGTSSMSGSGAANYVARWTSSTALGTGALYDSGTNVGIGSSSPQATLDIAGSENVSGTLSLTGNGTAQLYTSSRITSALWLSGGSASPAAAMVMMPTAGYNGGSYGQSFIDLFGFAGIGNTIFGQIIMSGGWPAANLGSYNGNYGPNMQVGPYGPYPLVLTTNNVPVMVIGSSGLVGIGTTNPQTTLDIAGYMRLSKNSAQPATCSSANDGAIALTAVYTLCVCEGGSSAWYSASNGTTLCAW